MDHALISKKLEGKFPDQKKKKIDMIGAVVMSVSNVSPSLLAVALHTFKPL